jgi:hypothetical protein
VVKRLLEIIKQYDINVIEVVGHTDEQPIAGKTSNLDRDLFPYLRGQSTVKLTPSDNAGLGLARAVAVLRFLREDQRLDQLRIIPLSAAQLIDVGDRLSTGAPYAIQHRRRIEIRVRRSDREPIPVHPDIPIQSQLEDASATNLAETVDAQVSETPGAEPGVSSEERSRLDSQRPSALTPWTPACSVMDQFSGICQ